MLSEKEDLYIQLHLNMEDITDVDLAHIKKVYKDFEVENLGEHHNLYVQSDTLLLADPHKNCRNMCLEKLEFDPIRFLTALGLAWQASLTKTEVTLDHLANIICYWWYKKV